MGQYKFGEERCNVLLIRVIGDGGKSRGGAESSDEPFCVPSTMASWAAGR